jgi:hypothetical protein
LKLTLEVSDAICKRITAAAGLECPASVEAFVQRAIESELRRIDGACVPQSDYGDLAAVAKQIQRLEKGQRAIIALVDSSATVLAALLRGRRARR